MILNEIILHVYYAQEFVNKALHDFHDLIVNQQAYLKLYIASRAYFSAFK